VPYLIEVAKIVFLSEYVSVFAKIGIKCNFIKKTAWQITNAVL